MTRLALALLALVCSAAGAAAACTGAGPARRSISDNTPTAAVSRRAPNTTPSPTAMDVFAYTATDGTVWLAAADGTRLQQLVGETVDPRAVGPGHDPHWSPDGRALSYETNAVELMVLDVASGATTVIDSSSDRVHRGFGAAWSSDGERLAYEKHVVEPDGSVHLDLWTSTPAGDARRVAEDVRAFAWSPDGTRLVYETATDVAPPPQPHGGPLFVIDARTMQARRIADVAVLGAWSPDGRYVAYWKDETGGSALVGDLTLQDVNTGREISLGRFTSDERPQWAPDPTQDIFQNVRVEAGGGTSTLFARPSALVAWSPDATQVVYVEGPPFGGGDHSLVLLDLATGERRTLHSGRSPSAHAGSPGYYGTWSPDSRYFAFWAMDGDAGGAAFVAGARGAVVRPLGLGTASWYGFAFSPDGQRLLIGGMPEDAPTIWSAAADGSGATKIGEGTLPSQPWRPRAR